MFEGLNVFFLFYVQAFSRELALFFGIYCNIVFWMCVFIHRCFGVFLLGLHCFA